METIPYECAVYAAERSCGCWNCLSLQFWMLNVIVRELCALYTIQLSLLLTSKSLYIKSMIVGEGAKEKSQIDVTSIMNFHLKVITFGPIVGWNTFDLSSSGKMSMIASKVENPKEYFLQCLLSSSDLSKNCGYIWVTWGVVKMTDTDTDTCSGIIWPCHADQQHHVLFLVWMSVGAGLCECVREPVL